jgi:aspartyl-tRNA(Asn)/glutamyl-tRNA(Gln) amidotransferase subunit B
VKYELVSGFETHIELSTKTKIFCGCTTQFGGEPNTHCCPVCIGLPGTLPVLNREVVRFAIKAGLAVHGEIAEVAKMDRKNSSRKSPHMVLCRPARRKSGPRRSNES